jgi:methionyl-tRNA formyltransferase
MRIILMSTPDFGRPTLRALLDRGYDVVGLICQPDKPAGRGLRPTPPPMKQVALGWDVPVLQPVSLSTAEARQQVSALRPDLILVAAYGKFIPDTILELAPIGALNLHPSLLPRWRGACPVPAAILAGDRETGVTIHFVVNEMDAGALLGQAAMPITERDRAGDLMARLAVLGADLYVATIEAWLAGRITPQTQDHTQAIWCDRLRKSHGRLDWTRPAEVLARQIRAFDPWPGTFTSWGDTSLRILDAEPWRDWRGDLAPGKVFCAAERIAVATGQGALVLHTVQAEGKRGLPVEEYWRGASGFVGALLG